jgi:hypothetical protein
MPRCGEEMLDHIEEQFIASGLLPHIPEQSSPAKDSFLFSLITTLLSVHGGCSTESIRRFTVYDFINFETRGYCSWSLSPFHLELLRSYFTTVRHRWVRQDKELHAFCYSPCGKLTAHTSKFFVASNGATDYSVPDEDIAAELRQQRIPSWKADCRGPARPTKRARRVKGALTMQDLRTDPKVQAQVFQMCLHQQWPGLEVQERSGELGRGVVAARHFVEGEILVDYHAPPIPLATEQEMMSASPSDRRSDYLFAGPGGLRLDGSSESCACHPETRIIGRLINFAARSTSECNAKPAFFKWVQGRDKLLVKSSIILVATRSISPLEEIRYDYGDSNCVEMFAKRKHLMFFVAYCFHS